MEPQLIMQGICTPLTTILCQSRMAAIWKWKNQQANKLNGGTFRITAVGALYSRWGDMRGGYEEIYKIIHRTIVWSFFLFLHNTIDCNCLVEELEKKKLTCQCELICGTGWFDDTWPTCFSKGIEQIYGEKDQHRLQAMLTTCKLWILEVT